MTSHLRRAATLISRFAGLPAALFLLATTNPAFAEVGLRVEARPLSDPIQAFVTVTSNAGVPVAGLDDADFTVTIDGLPVTIDDFTLPPAQDANQSVSVVFAMDYSQSVQTVALDSMRTAVKTFINGMQDGDQAAIIKFNDTNPLRASIVIPFTEIDHGANNVALDAAVDADYDGDGTNLLDALELAVNHFLSPPTALPLGPKAIIVISDGGENQSSISESELIDLANANSLPIFTIGVGELDLPGRTELMTGLGGETGGEYFPTSTDDEIADAYDAISLRLSNEYLLTIPSGIADCGEHELEVTVTNQATPASVLFTRRVCDTEPNAFTFNAQTGVARGQTVTSNTVTIGGIEAPAHISVLVGLYSIGCNGTFTRDPGEIEDGDTVCVRLNASDQPSTEKTSTLTIGGVSSVFSVTTRAGGGDGGGGGGGGGPTGLVELLLLALGVLFLGRRRTV